jgi:hypothetical protein
MRWHRRMCRQHNRRRRTNVCSPGSGSSAAVLGVACEAEERPERRPGLEGSLELAADARRPALAGTGSSAGGRPPAVRLHGVNNKHEWQASSAAKWRNNYAHI